MGAKELTYPVFEANQVLSSSHLNELFEYLDEQTRLTRANLIGIGIACGLEVRFEAPGTVHLSKGCGVTSQGYLIVEPTDLALAHVRSYKLPIEPGYPPFTEPGTSPAEQFDLWELFPDDDEPGAQPLDTSGLVLEDKAVVLFLELSNDRLRNCSPNNCDDRGTEVTSTVRRLLVDVADLDKVIAATSALAPTYLGADLTERLQLPDIRMPRVDVPSTGRVTPEAVLFAFQDTFRQNRLAARTAAALTALYEAFKPLVIDVFPANPFTGFTNRFGFLDAVPATTAQVRFMQYYWDLFDDLIAAYDEVRWTGLDLMCACCPPEGLFPRHLMAGVLDPENYDAADYRHRFIPSPAVGDCVDRTRYVRSLFGRLVAIVESFTETPPDKGIRATPSRWGDVPLSAKAIPYYFDQSGTPPVLELWDPAKTARGRATQNLSYRADDYSPAPPAFVTDPLRFDLEPNNFLRIEGHLGKNVQSVLESLLSLKNSYRLPIEVVALRTGAFDENMDIDLSKEKCRFQDLETLYETLRAELTCFLVKQVQYFYALPMPDGVGEGSVAPTLGLLKTFAPDFVAEPGTLGRTIESVLTWRPGRPLMFVPFRAPTLLSQVFALVGAMSDLAVRLTDDLRQVDFPTIEDRYRTLVEIARQMDELRLGGAFDEPGLGSRLDDIVFRCRLDPFKALADEYKRRVRDAKQAGFLGNFLEHHPGVQHKAGVPLGGTFILVYHELATEVAPPTPPAVDTGDISIGDLGSGIRVGLKNTFQLDESNAKLLSSALARLQYKEKLAEDPDLQLLYKVVTGNVLVPRPPVSGFADQVYLDAVASLPDRAVIADFFLPYECCSNCPPIQYQLPPARLRVSATKACTNADGSAEVALTTEGASGSLSVQVDSGSFEELAGSLLLRAGDHTVVVRDAAGNESSPLQISVPPQLVISDAQTNVDRAAGTYQVVASLQGGTPPYATDAGTVVDATYTSQAVPVADVLTVVVKDAAGCTVEGTFKSGVDPCDLPCDGAAVRQGFRFWLPEARERFPINEYKVEVSRFTITEPDGDQPDLTAGVSNILQQSPSPIRTADFAGVAERWLDEINNLVAGAVGSDKWFRLEYEAAPETGTTGVLFVDRLTCIEFSFDLAVSFVQGQRKFAFEFTYNSRGTVVVERNGGSKFRIPPFRASTSNKCRPGERAVLLCEDTDLGLAFEPDLSVPDVVTLKAEASGNDEAVAFLWEVQDGIPSVAGGGNVAVRFERTGSTEKLVRLTGFTKKGCAVTFEKVINIPDRNN